TCDCRRPPVPDRGLDPALPAHYGVQEQAHRKVPQARQDQWRKRLYPNPYSKIGGPPDDIHCCESNQNQRCCPGRRDRQRYRSSCRALWLRFRRGHIFFFNLLFWFERGKLPVSNTLFLVPAEEPIYPERFGKVKQPAPAELCNAEVD